MSTTQPPELGTGERPSTYVVGEADSSGTTLTISEAARRSGLSISTLRRRLAKGSLSGAHKAPGPDGEEWRIPVAALEGLSVESSKRTTSDDQATEIEELRRQLVEERRTRELAEALLDSERRGREDLARTVDVLREAIETLNRALPPARSTPDTKSPRRWKRSK